MLGEKMYLVGELRDKQMAEEIVADLNSRQIPVFLNYHAESDMYVILTSEEQGLPLAQDFFRVKMGFKKPVELDQEWVKIKKLPRGEYTYAIVVACVLLYLASYLNFGNLLVDSLFIGKVDSPLFYEVFHGQIWRVITPIFLHLSFMHILFNMLWFKDLGYLIENSFGKNFLLLFVLGTGLVSNIGQYLVGGPQFGGMSGVLYAMLGFIWVYKKCNTDFEYALPKFDIGMMIGWYFLCLTGVLGPIANTAHGVGLVSGMVIAPAMNFRPEKTRLKYLAIALFFFVFTLAVEGYKLNGRYYVYLWTQNGQ